MKRISSLNRITVTGVCIALCYILPLAFHSTALGTTLSPMHIPVLLCGFFCGAPWGLVVGLLTPIVRSAILGMPQMFPMAVAMAFELATYGFVAGCLHQKLQKRTRYVYVALLGAMVIGRLVWGAVMFACMGFDVSKFGLSAFLAGAVINAIPGIILQLVLVPVLVISLKSE